VLGGFVDSRTLSDEILRFDRTTKTTTTVGKLPFPLPRVRGLEGGLPRFSAFRLRMWWPGVRQLELRARPICSRHFATASPMWRPSARRHAVPRRRRRR